ncbi:MAG: dihydroorotase [Oscillospiraceae bacterium]|nr:dihydroorotase [Oscillospiraceae bacterium]
MNSILIKNGHVIDPANNIDKKLDIYVEDGKIKEVGENLSKGDTVVDAKGKVVVPGLIDMHCHLREPGQEYKEDIESGSNSAAVGGFTSIACMPNTTPVIDNGSVVNFIKTRPARVNVYPIGAITKGQKGERLSLMAEMKKEGIVAVSEDGDTVANSGIMRNALQYASNFNLPVIAHCEDDTLGSDGIMNEGYLSTILGLKGINKAVEENIIARDILIAENDKQSIHIAHVTTKGGVELIRQAKARGVAVTCETCPQYFSLTEDAVDGFNTYAKMNPPLRTKEDVEAVKIGLKDGTIDAIATDHAPHHINDKNCEMAFANNGMVGFETAFGLGVTNLVNEGHLTLNELIEKMSYTPAAILRLDKGTLGVGKDADITIVDTECKWTVDIEKFVSKAKNSPLDGFKLTGKAAMTIVGGKVVMEDGALV